MSLAALITALLSGVAANPYPIGGQPAGCTITVNSQVHHMASADMLTYTDSVVFCYNGVTYVAVNSANANVNVP